MRDHPGRMWLSRAAVWMGRNLPRLDTGSVDFVQSAALIDQLRADGWDLHDSDWLAENFAVAVYLSGKDEFAQVAEAIRAVAAMPEHPGHETTLHFMELVPCAHDAFVAAELRVEPAFLAGWRATVDEVAT